MVARVGYPMGMGDCLMRKSGWSRLVSACQEGKYLHKHELRAI